MTSYLQTGMTRIVAMQKEALEPVFGAAVDAYATWPYFQNSYPYWTTRPGAASNADLASDVRVHVRNMLMRLVLAKWQTGFTGELTALAVDAITNVRDFFALNEGLTSTAYPNEQDDLMPGFRGYITQDTGLVIFDNGTLGDEEIGVEFTLELQYVRRIYRNQ